MQGKLTRLTKLIYGFGDTGFSLTTTIIGAYFAIFLTDVVGIAPGTAAIAIFLGRSWDYVNDPIIGHISDRTRTRWGRRRPFLLFGALPFALAYMLMWFRPPFDSQVLLAVYYAVGPNSAGSTDPAARLPTRGVAAPGRARRRKPGASRRGNRWRPWQPGPRH